MRKVAVIISALVLTIVLIVIAAGCPAPADFTVGNKNFTEQYIIGQMMKQLLEDRGFKVNLVSDLTTFALRDAMEADEVDICADYTGTGWIIHLGHEFEQGTDNNELYDLVKDEDEGNGFIWLNPMWNGNTYALASWPEFVGEHELQTLSDLAALYRENDGKIKTFVGLEFSTRLDGLPALEELYDFEIDEGFLMTDHPEASLVALENHEVDVAMVFGTDAAIFEHGWHVYVEDVPFFPPYDLTPYVRAEVLDEYPEIQVILNELVATFPGGGEPATAETISECQQVWQELNAKVDIEKMEPHEVAREYLLQHGLIRE